MQPEVKGMMGAPNAAATGKPVGILATMFGLGKKAIPLDELADVLSNAAIRPLIHPTEQDVMFQTQAASCGVGEACFWCEASVLQFFAVTTAINTHKLSGGIRPDVAPLLVEAMLRSYVHKFENDLPFNAKLAFNLYAKEASGVEFIFQRVEQYATSENFAAPHQKVPELFSQFCGAPDRNGVLERIGWSIFIVRGNVYIDTLKKLKVV